MVAWRIALWLTVLTVAAVPATAVTGPDDFDGPTDVKLFLYTQRNPTTPEYLVTDNDDLSPSFNPEIPTRLVIHGGNTNVQRSMQFREAYLATGNDYNIVLVDWSGVAALPEMTAMRTSILVADYIGEVLNYFIDHRGLDPNRLYLIGGSMGGQVAGVVGNRVKGGAAAELVALDPASDIFDANPLENQLDPSDAQFVQIIHTNAGGMGVPNARGHADFFPNGGVFQVMCGTYTEGDDLCSHSIGDSYYTESIASDNFVATLCDSYEHYLEGLCGQNEHVQMGENTPTRSSGSYFLNTNKESPYAQGKTNL